MQIAFTFDDGPNTTTTVEILNLFKEYDGKASFFMIGNNISEETIPVMQRMVEEGHEIENHSFSHPAFSGLTKEKMLEEVTKTTELIEGAVDKKVRFFRPPYIAYNKEVFETVPYVFICGLGCDDWDENKPVNERIDEILNFAEDGVIVLLHDSEGNSQTVEALKVVLPILKDGGYDFVTVSDLFKNKGLEPKPFEEVIYSRV